MFKLEKPKDNFTRVCNELLKDKRISFRAKGLYSVMFSKPDDLVFYEGALVDESTEGRDAGRAAMKELIDAGWVSKEQPRDTRGYMIPAVIRLHTSVAGKSTTTKTDRTNTDEVIPPVSPQPTKASRRGRAPAISLDEFLQNSGGEPPITFGHYADTLGWSPEFAAMSGGNFVDTGEAPMQGVAALSATGLVPGRTGVMVKTADEAERMAIALTADLLPPSVQAWLTAMERHRLVVASVGGRPR
ncbi:hypothetical protein [Bradyrhizobium sp. SYSU BS000235]|uniref:hypothetical protein n=1 Tax=Bradyrhizobium sp. SYSU BS000235 TaxID=3411332 RepID=UPI003C75FC34